MKAFETKIVNVTKGNVYVEYKTARWAEWKTYPKKFKSVTKANEWIIKNVTKE